MDLSKVSNITIPEGSVIALSINGVDIWSAGTGGLIYTLEDGVYVVTAYEGTDTVVKIPRTHTQNGVKATVKTIGARAFADCDDLTNVVIPDSITKISSYAFSGCSNLESITIPFVGNAPNASTTTTQLFGYIFGVNPLIPNNNYVPTSLKTVIITGGTSIGSAAFSGCSSIEGITITNNITSIGSSAFGDCSSLTKVNYTGTIDEWVEILFNTTNSNPLYYAKNLYINNELVTEAKLTTATKINDYAFYNCSSLTSITIPKSVTSIGKSAFYNCSSLTTIYYEGTEEEWQNVTKGTSWKTNCNATVIFESGLADTTVYSYYGANSSDVVSDDLFAALSDSASSLFDEPIKVTVDTSAYIWFISPTAINSITSSGFPVPYTEIESSYSYNGENYHCYRLTGLTTTAGTYTFNIE